MKNKQDMLIFGAYASMVISIGYFVMILYKKCMSLYDKFYSSINGKGEE